MEIKHAPGRFYAKTGSSTAELLYSKVDGKTISAYHTFTPEEERGKGIAEQLTTAVFEYAKENGLMVRPDCPYVSHFLRKHKEWRKYAAP
jgi:predicted GNAT family acetyltransferase